MKCRTTFYTALTRLLSVELTDEVEEFERFMAPLQSFSPFHIFPNQHPLLLIVQLLKFNGQISSSLLIQKIALAQFYLAAGLF